MASLTVLGVCDNSNRRRMDMVVESEARKIGFLNPRCAVAEIKQEKGSWWLALNRFCIADMWKHFETDFVLVVQFDGRIFNPGAWNDGFFNYDWIGAPWPDGVCGNGGFCLRSGKLCKWISENLTGAWESGYARYVGRGTQGNEDAFICRTSRRRIEAAGFKFAPKDVASRFSVERGKYEGQLGVHHIASFFGRQVNLKTASDPEIDGLFQTTRNFKI